MYDEPGTVVVEEKVRPVAWDGQTGGVVAMVGQSLRVKADIDASADWFTNDHQPTATVVAAQTTGVGEALGRGSDGMTGTNYGTWDSNFADGAKGVAGGGKGGGGGEGLSTVAFPQPQPGPTKSGSNGGGRAGGAVNYDRSSGAWYRAAGANGATGIGSGLPVSAGGGGGIIGGGGGGGSRGVSGAGGGTDGGGSGGFTRSSDHGSGGSGGGVLSVGNGGDGQAGRKSNGTNYAAAGGGGGSYGGGGGSGGANFNSGIGAGGGGGGSWTGGGAAGKGGHYRFLHRAAGMDYNFGLIVGGAGNASLGAQIPDERHGLNSTNRIS